MTNRTLAVVAAVILGLAALFVARPYIDYRLYAATNPRSIEPRGDLAEYERATIALFERVSPSVVQVVGRGAEVATTRGEEAQVQTGTGFVWDQAGHVVTNDHVVEGATALAVRLASGEAVKGEIVGVAGVEGNGQRALGDVLSSLLRRSAARPTSRLGNRRSLSAIRSVSTNRSPPASSAP